MFCDLIESLYRVLPTVADNSRPELKEIINTQYKLDAIGITKYDERRTDDQRAL